MNGQEKDPTCCLLLISEITPAGCLALATEHEKQSDLIRKSTVS